MKEFNLGCDTCINSCCKSEGGRDSVIHLFPSDFSYSGSYRTSKMKFENEKCIFLSDDNLCTIYNKRPITCWSYPFMIDIYNNVYLSSTCPNIGKILIGLSFDDPITLKYVKIMKEKLKELPVEIKFHWHSLIGDKFKYLIRI